MTDEQRKQLIEAELVLARIMHELEDAGLHRDAARLNRALSELEGLLYDF